MERFYHDITTFLGGLDPVVKGLIIGILLMFIVLTLRSIVKAHVNSKKFSFKVGQFVLLAILFGVTIFIVRNVF